MRYRQLDSNGDMTFGQGSANFLIDSVACVEQAILTGLNLWQGEWFLNLSAGMPWSQDVLGFRTQGLYDQAIQSQIKGTQGVTGITSYGSSLNTKTRLLAFSVSGQSIYGPFSISTSVPTVGGGFGAGGFGEGGFGTGGSSFTDVAAGYGWSPYGNVGYGE